MVVPKTTFDRILEVINIQKELLNEFSEKQMLQKETQKEKQMLQKETQKEKQMLQTKAQIISQYNETDKPCCMFCGSDFSRYSHPIGSGRGSVNGLTIENTVFECSACNNKSKVFFITEDCEKDRIIDIQIIKNGKWTSNWEVSNLPYADKDTINNPQWLQDLLDGKYPDGILCKVKDYPEDDYRVDIIIDYSEEMKYEGKVSYWSIAEPVYLADSTIYKGAF